MKTYRAILKRVGLVLIVVGALDIGYMIYCVSNGQGYSSSFNVFALVAGIFLIRGHMGAVRLVTWFSAFMLAGFAGAFLILFPVWKPIGLWAAELRLHPIDLFLTMASGLAAVALLFWVYRQLRDASVVAARVAAGQSASPPTLAFVVGVALVVFLSAMTHFTMGGEAGAKAVELARSTHGGGHEYHVTGLRWSGGHTWASLSAYNEHEIKSVEVEWQE